ncbi:MAG: hypothetical protein NTY02_18130 [Acidobacteria bacterium]|nr:hypothetical protein [Acidobacteriota bacterium]
MSDHQRVRVTAVIACFALTAGCAIAWMDTRPSWDDTGVTAGALFLASALASALGVRWWLAPIMVAGPLLVAEIRGLGWGALLICAIALAGAGIGLAVRRLTRSGS